MIRRGRCWHRSPGRTRERPSHETYWKSASGFIHGRQWAPRSISLVRRGGCCQSATPPATIKLGNTESRVLWGAAAAYELINRSWHCTTGPVHEISGCRCWGGSNSVLPGTPRVSLPRSPGLMNLDVSATYQRTCRVHRDEVRPRSRSWRATASSGAISPRRAAW